jgi:hypothetical protein
LLLNSKDINYFAMKYSLKYLLAALLPLTLEAQASICNEVDVFPWFTPVEGTYDNEIGDHRFYEIRADIQNIDKGRDQFGRPKSPTSVVQFTYTGAYASEAISNGTAVYTLEPSTKAQLKSEVIARFEAPLSNSVIREIRRELNVNSKKDNLSASVCMNSDLDNVLVLQVPSEGEFSIDESVDLVHWNGYQNLGTLTEGQVLVINWTSFLKNYQNAFPSLDRSFFRLNANFVNPNHSNLDLDALVRESVQNGASGEVVQVP